MRATASSPERSRGRFRHAPVIAASVLTFVLFAVALNSVGPVIMQSILTFGVSKTDASLLEGAKDLSIAASSFFVSLALPALGYRRGTAIGLAAMGLASLAIPLVDAFWMLKVQFVVVGIAFAAAKTSVYVIVGLVTRSTKEHASATSILEGVFMVGVVSSYWLFSTFIDPHNPASPVWLDIYWWLGGAAFFVALLMMLAPLDERLAEGEHSTARDTLLAMPRLLPIAFVIAFLVAAFLDVLVEQSVGSWLPTFNREILHLPAALAVQLASLNAAGLAVGRLAAGLLLRRVRWIWVVGGGVLVAAMLIVIGVPLAASLPDTEGAGWTALPLAAFALPATGLFLAPIYPVLCSAVLSGLPSRQHSTMTGLILISSALGGTIGSFITGRIFSAMSGKVAFLAILPAMAALLAAIIVFDATLRRAQAAR